MIIIIITKIMLIIIIIIEFLVRQTQTHSKNNDAIKMN